jgi:hypothetical protein
MSIVAQVFFWRLLTTKVSIAAGSAVWPDRAININASVPNPSSPS